jgi:hypothetical protein
MKKKELKELIEQGEGYFVEFKVTDRGKSR